MDRRDFLRPRRLAETAGHLVGAAREVESLPAAIAQELADKDVEAALLRFSRRAMATNFEIVLPYGMRNALDGAEAALDEVDRLEDQLSVYRETSEVSRLNARASSEAVRVESDLFSLLQLAARLHNESGGAHDIAAGALVKAWGFYRGPRRVPASDELHRCLGRVGMRFVTLDPHQKTVRYLRPGLEINLGSIGKGYALDRAATLLRDRWQMPAALLHGGHSSVYAIGNQPGCSRGWPIGLADPKEPGRRLAVVWLKDRGLGTSAATFQHLEHQGRTLGHLLDPRTGWPAEGIASATVLAPTAAEADALATAFFVLGVEGAKAYCERHPEVGAVLLPDIPRALPLVLNLTRKDVSFVDRLPETLLD